MLPVITFNVTAFRAAFPAFSDVIQFPDALLQGYWDSAICIMNPTNYGYLQDTALQPSRTRALNLLTAHLTQVGVIVANGDIPLVETQATIDKISITSEPPPTASQFRWWLNTTAYGKELLVLINAFAVGGFLFGALPERSAIRNVGSIFPGASFNTGVTG